jgi:signal transduction histidine kinase/CheY-like chemotaxis protein
MMDTRISFWNWSVKKLLAFYPDSFFKAKINIVLTILILSILKVIVLLSLSWFHGQSIQFSRAIILIILYVVLLKLVLNSIIKIKFITHILIWIALILIVSNILFYSKTVNLLSLQFAYMITLSSFYILGNRFGIIYSFLANLPIVIYMMFGSKFIFYPDSAEALISPTFEIIAFLNMVTIVYSHYLFQRALSANILEKENLNVQLKIAVKNADQAAQSKSNFLSTMSHELRTPLNSVIGMTDLFLENPNASDKEENLKILKFSAFSLKTVIDDILDFNKLGFEKLHLEAISINLNSLMLDICAGLEIKAKEKGIELILAIDEVLKHQLVISDPTRITQIMFNLVGNAIKFTSAGSVTVNLKAININEDKINVRFSVVDTGIGIHENHFEQIFEPFSQASTSTTRNFGGTGLGLPIVKRLLGLFESDIHLESTLHKGSDFCFEIDFLRDKHTKIPEYEQDEDAADLSDLRILVAEDNLMNRMLLKKVLSKWNNEPVFVENGQEAIDQVLLQNFDVILIDLHMPLMDGYTAAKAIRELPNKQKSQIPIIAFTASVSNNLDDKIKLVGMNDYILKPFNIKDLYNKLKIYK